MYGQANAHCKMREYSRCRWNDDNTYWDLDT